MLLVVNNVPGIASNADVQSAKLACCKECLDQLPEEERVLLRDYYLGARVGEAKRIRAEVASDLSVRHGALRVRVFRTKQKLIRCIGVCTKASRAASA
jgi:DNA-directed RNA polymerase specialized sigma24 family protein